jgi:hypothetical protein
LKKQLVAVLASLSVSGQVCADEISDLIAASDSILSTVDNGSYIVSGLSYYAGIGGIAESDAIDAGLISQMQLDAYNNALAAVEGATYYNAEMFFQDQAEEALEQVSIAIDSFVDATGAMSQVITVFDMASQATDTETQLALQSYVTDNSLELTQGQVLEYNEALESVQTYSQMAAAFIQASQNDFITSTVDANTESWNESLLTSTASYSQVNDYLNISFVSQQNGVGFVGFFQSDMKSALDIMGAGQSIYEGQTL